MIVIGLTGSIAMGKSEIARMFRKNGVPVFDADETVHKLYESGGAAVAPIGSRFPETIVNAGVDRARLAELVLGDKLALKDLEAIVHPLVQEARETFLSDAELNHEPIVVLDIPLLFETGATGEVDYIVVASASATLQRERALRRPGMTEKKFEQILAKQAPDEIKRRQADFVVDSSKGLDEAERQVRDIIASLKLCS